MILYQNKYRTTGNRLPGWDYSKDGKYYITICVKNMEQIFGEIIDGQMVLNELGKILEVCWFDLPNHYENLILDEFIIMPNHMHMIMVIRNPVCFVDCRDGFQTHLYNNDNKPVLKHGISEFVRALKTFASRRINEIRNTLGKTNWQFDFWDEIIRTDERYYEIKEYIRNNPKNWRV